MLIAVRLRIDLAYDGTDFYGWAKQPDMRTVQGEIERVLHTILRVPEGDDNEPLRLTVAGRTDTGVHAAYAVAHFDVAAPLTDPEHTAYKLNCLLPDDVAVFGVAPVADDAHARFSAAEREYRYFIESRKNPFTRRAAWHYYRPLDVERMDRAAASLLEYDDFTSFAKLNSNNKTNICRIVRAGWEESPEGVYRFTIRAELPAAAMPAMDWEVMRSLFPVALTIALLGAIESLLSATVADGVTGDRHDSNTELMAQGAANLLTPLFGGIPATGAIARTMTNINNGGRTPVAGIIHAGVLLILLLMMPLAQYIPMACLAGVLVVVSYNMSGWRTFRALLRTPLSDRAVLLVTFFLTVVFDLTVAIEVGLLIACVLFLRRVMETTEISVIRNEIDPSAGSDARLHEEPLAIPSGIEVYEIDGPYFFGIATRFEELMMQMGDRPRVRIIRMRRVPFIDSTGLHNLETLCRMSQRAGSTLVLSGVNPGVRATLENAGICNLLGEENICPDIHAALERARVLAAQSGTGK